MQMYAFPPLYPATADNMNCVSVVYVITLIVVVAWWFLKARSAYDPVTPTQYRPFPLRCLVLGRRTMLTGMNRTLLGLVGRNQDLVVRWDPRASTSSSSLRATILRTTKHREVWRQYKYSRRMGYAMIGRGFSV
ncbi:hypothetical protein BDP81DRAFT_436712 [Colletotrichum phormii]|uniref:Uncharacterized protein n=1 Tax=Colletotrichum phormii TaxID=359342 RepID=A0AAI9ZHY9_9PEZI|nr:uncharacterized protein BDP81DRAFT_436712 [Colletotrichum phormii]KAK1624905.1 hypothetical protein BDP81DRAFT_436712 [Colletotrichum phormii]